MKFGLFLEMSSGVVGEMIELSGSVVWWVLIPVFVTVFLVAIIQDNLRVIVLEGAAPPKLSLTRLRMEHLLLRASRLRTGCNIMSQESFMSRRTFFCGPKHGRLTRALQQLSRDGHVARFGSSIIEQWSHSPVILQYLFNAAPPLLLGALVSSFFSGYISATLPFPLPASFSSLLHGALLLPSLPTRYISSVSWFALALMGVRSLPQLLTTDYSSLRNPPPAPPAPPSFSMSSPSSLSPIPGGPLASLLMGVPTGGSFSDDQRLAAERDGILMAVRDASVLDGAEARILAKWKK